MLLICGVYTTFKGWSMKSIFLDQKKERKKSFYYVKKGKKKIILLCKKRKEKNHFTMCFSADLSPSHPPPRPGQDPTENVRQVILEPHKNHRNPDFTTN